MQQVSRVILDLGVADDSPRRSVLPHSHLATMAPGVIGACSVAGQELPCKGQHVRQGQEDYSALPSNNESFQLQVLGRGYRGGASLCKLVKVLFDEQAQGRGGTGYFMPKELNCRGIFGALNLQSARNICCSLSALPQG